MLRSVSFWLRLLAVGLAIAIGYGLFTHLPRRPISLAVLPGRFAAESKDGKWAVTCGSVLDEDGAPTQQRCGPVRIWNRSTGKVTASYLNASDLLGTSRHGSYGVCSFTPTGRFLLARNYISGPCLWVFDPVTQTQRRLDLQPLAVPNAGQESAFSPVEFSHDDAFVIVRLSYIDRRMPYAVLDLENGRIVGNAARGADFYDVRFGADSTLQLNSQPGVMRYDLRKDEQKLIAPKARIGTAATDWQGRSSFRSHFRAKVFTVEDSENDEFLWKLHDLNTGDVSEIAKTKYANINVLQPIVSPDESMLLLAAKASKGYEMWNLRSGGVAWRRDDDSVNPRFTKNGKSLLRMHYVPKKK